MCYERRKKNPYSDFDEYLRQGEPTQREAAFAWSTAIGLQAVDGLKTVYIRFVGTHSEYDSIKDIKNI